MDVAGINNAIPSRRCLQTVRFSSVFRNAIHRSDPANPVASSVKPRRNERPQLRRRATCVWLPHDFSARAINFGSGRRPVVPRRDEMFVRDSRRRARNDRTSVPRTAAVDGHCSFRVRQNAVRHDLDGPNVSRRRTGPDITRLRFGKGMYETRCRVESVIGVPAVVRPITVSRWPHSCSVRVVVRPRDRTTLCTVLLAIRVYAVAGDGTIAQPLPNNFHFKRTNNRLVRHYSNRIV